VCAKRQDVSNCIANALGKGRFVGRSVAAATAII
jgi:hypothetical protein